MNTPFQVENITVFPQLNRIKIDGHFVSLEPRVMKLLVHLVVKKGELCTREALVQDVWGGDFVNKNALTRAMSDLRKAFKETTDKPRYFETIPKQGYRFIAKVRYLENESNTRIKYSKQAVWRAAAVLVIIFTAVSIFPSLITPKINYGNKVIRKSVPVIVKDTTNLPDSVFHRKVEAIVDAEVAKEMRED